MKLAVMTSLFCLLFNFAFSQNGKAIFLVHSTGTNLYNRGKVSVWLDKYNSVHGTKYQITTRAFPNTPWPWENYPYDYWKLWVNNSCENSDLDIECLPSIASAYDLVIFKHCFPGAGIAPSNGNPDVTSKIKTLENYKLQYRQLRSLMDGMPDKKFMIWTLVPLHRLATNSSTAARAYEFVNWVKNEWLTEDGQSHPNIYIFDFYSLASETNENPINGQQYCLKYEYELSHEEDDSHPNQLANDTIGPLFAQAVVDCLAPKLISSITVSSITNQSNISSNKGTLQLQANVLPIDAKTKSVVWSQVNNTGKASISSTGLLTAENNGTVTAVASAIDGSGIKGELQITISNQTISVESISLSSPSGTSISTDNGTLQLQAELNPSDATTKTLIWTVQNESGKASIDPTGLLTSEKNGTVTAIATANDGSGIKGELQITISNQVIPLESINLSSPSGTSISTDNGTLQLQAELIPSDATTKTLIWTVQNESGRASISPTGLLTADNNGTVIVIASASDGSGIKGELQITISNQIISVENIILSSPLGTSISTDNGTLQVQAELFPSDATTKTLIWAVQNESGKASIDPTGLLSAEKNGTVTAIATASDGSGIKSELQIIISNQIIPIESINLSSSSNSSISTDNGTLQLQSELFPSDATTKTLIWTVQNESGKASISPTGLLTAEQNGTVTAIATANDGSGIKGELQITISNQIIPLEYINLSSSSGTSISIDNGTLQLQAELIPSDATTKTLIWTVQNESGKASIDPIGLLTAENNGTVNVIASASDGSGIKGELQIIISNQIIPIENLEIIDNLGNDTINGLTAKINLTVSIWPLDATNQNIDWSIENITGTAIINSEGILTPLTPGQIRVTAQSTDQSNLSCQKDYQIIIPLGNFQNIDSQGTKIFPNPTSGKISIHLDQVPLNGAGIEIRNTTGRILIDTRTFNKLTDYELKDNNTEYYTVTIRLKNKMYSQKILYLSHQK